MERVYLLNVLIYININEINTTRTFLEINHKCREVGQMLRIYTKKRTLIFKPNGQFIHPDPFIPRDIYDLFPSIETIECDFDTIYPTNEINVIDKCNNFRVYFNRSFMYLPIQSQFIKVFKKTNTISVYNYHFVYNERMKETYPSLKKMILIDQTDIITLFNNDTNVELDELVIRYTKSTFEKKHLEIIEQCIQKYNLLIDKTPVTYTMNKIEEDHPCRSAVYLNLVNQAIDEGSLVIVPLLNEQDLDDIFTSKLQQTLFIDIRNDDGNDENKKFISKCKVLRIHADKSLNMTNDIDNHLVNLQTQLYPGYVVLINQWNVIDEAETGTYYLQMMSLADSLIKRGYKHICMSSVPFHSFPHYYFSDN